MKTPPVLRRLALAASAFLLLHAGTSFAAERVRLAINLAPVSALTLVAQQKGLFTKNGLDVAIANFSSGRQALETVLGGGADVATAAESPVTAATFANQKVALLSRIEYSQLKTLVAFPGYKKPSDLKGKKLGYAAGTGSEVYTAELLKRIGLTKADVTLVALRPQDMAAALASGGVDAYSIWEPHIANGRKALGDKAQLIDLENVYAETMNIVVTEDYARKNPKVSAALLKSLIEAEQWLKANPNDAVTLVASAVGMKKEELAEIWDDYVFEVVLDKRTSDTLRNHAQWRIDSGNAAGGATAVPDFGKVIFTAPLKEIAPDRVRL